MSVTFGTPVTSTGSSSSQGATLPMTGVTSGQPIIVLLASANSYNMSSISISDTFSTPYTWTVVQTEGNSNYAGLAIVIGTGGAGTSGTITATVTSGSGYIGGWAVSCNGASTASGLSAVDAYGGALAGTGTTLSSVSITPTLSGEGVVYAVGGNQNITSGPASPWVNTTVNCGGSFPSSVMASTYQSPPSGSALTCTWTAAAANSQNTPTLGLIVKAAASAPTANSGFLAFMGG